MKACLLPLTIPESLLCRTLAQILGQWQPDTYTLPSNIHTASRTYSTASVASDKKKRKNKKKKEHPPTKQQIWRDHPEEPQERELSTFHGEATAQESLPSKNWIKIFVTQLVEISETWQYYTLDTWRHVCFVFWERNPVTTHCSCKAEGKEATLGIFPLFLSPFSSFVAGMNWWSKQTRWHPWVKWHHLWPLRLCPQAPLLVCL